MSDRDKIIEVMKNGMFGAAEWSSFWAEDEAYKLCEAALAALHAVGLAVVPVEPTEAMLAAGKREIFGYSKTADASEFYRAMVAAAKETER